VVPSPRRSTLGHADRTSCVRRPAPGIRGAASALGRRAAAHDPVPSDEARRALRAGDPPARTARGRPALVAGGVRSAARRRARDSQRPGRALGRSRLGQLARSYVPSRRQGRRAARRQGRRRPACAAALRSSFGTLLIYKGQPPQYVAEQLGHSAATLLRDYARVWEGFDPSQRVSAEEQIEQVRSRVHRTVTAPGIKRAGRRPAESVLQKSGRVPEVFAKRPRRLCPIQRKSPISGDFARALCRTRTDDPFLTMEVLYQLS
jgi:hypothetical protein